MRLTNFENYRKDKLPVSNLISVITIDNMIESGWTNGRDYNEIIEDFGEKDKNWFHFLWQAEVYLKQHKKDNI